VKYEARLGVASKIAANPFVSLFFGGMEALGNAFRRKKSSRPCAQCGQRPGTEFLSGLLVCGQCLPSRQQRGPAVAAGFRRR
jgi:hypothetical protein